MIRLQNECLIHLLNQKTEMIYMKYATVFVAALLTADSTAAPVGGALTPNEDVRAQSLVLPGPFVAVR